MLCLSQCCVFNAVFELVVFVSVLCFWCYVCVGAVFELVLCLCHLSCLLVCSIDQQNLSLCVHPTPSTQFHIYGVGVSVLGLMYWS